MNNIKVLFIRTNEYCNAHCFMCDFWKNRKKEITEEQFEKALKMMDKGELIRFTGGEPLLCEKLPYYIKKCHSKGIKTSIITNGLILNEKLEQLVENGLDQIIISVDGSNPNLHDSLRGTNGLWNKIDKTLEKINRDYPYLHTRVNTVVSEKNLSDLTNIKKWLEKHNVEQWSLIPVKLNGHKWSEAMDLEIFKQEYSKFQDNVKDCKVKLMGYSFNWAIDIEEFWKGDRTIKPREKCNLTSFIAFYNPFKEHLYPCNCVPHRELYFCSMEEEKKWYYEHGHDYCKGCEPLNAYCADHPEIIKDNIFNF